MAKLLFRLKNVNEDEAAEVRALLADNDIAFYETEPGNWGISMPALWLVNEADYPEVRAMLDDYSKQRYQRVREEYEYLKGAGKTRTFMDMAKENPFKVALYLAIVFVLVYFSIAPFLSMV